MSEYRIIELYLTIIGSPTSYMKDVGLSKALKLCLIPYFLPKSMYWLEDKPDTLMRYLTKKRDLPLILREAVHSLRFQAVLA